MERGIYMQNEIQKDLHELLTLIANATDPNRAVVTVAELIENEIQRGNN